MPNRCKPILLLTALCGVLNGPAANARQQFAQQPQIPDVPAPSGTSSRPTERPSAPFKIEPVRVLRASQHRVSGVYTLDLSNNIRLHVRPMPQAVNVSICLRVLGGELNETAATRGLTNAVATSWRSLLPAAGDAPTMQVFSGPEGLSIRTTFTPTKLAEAFQRVVSYPRDRHVHPEVFARVKETALSRAVSARRGEGFGAVIAAMRVSSDERFGPPEPANVEAWTIESARAWLDTLLDSQPIEIAIAGPVTIKDAQAAALAALEPIRASIQPAPGHWDSLRTAKRDLPAGTIRLHSGGSPGGNAHIVLPGPDADDLRASRAAAVGVKLMQARLRAALDEQGQKFSRVVVVSNPARGIRGVGMTMINLRLRDTADPEDSLTRLATAFNSTLVDVKDGKFPTDEQLSQATGEIISEVSRQIDDPKYWASVLSLDSFHGIEPDELAIAIEDVRTMAHDRIRSFFASLGRFEDARCVVSLPGAGKADPAPKTAPTNDPAKVAPSE